MKLRVGLQVAAQVLVVIFLSQAVTKAGPPVGGLPQHFVCNTGYSLSKCQADMAVLRKTLAKYPAAELGEWTWVLVRSADWKYVVMPQGIDPDSPAFTYLPKRETFIEEALVAKVPHRAEELIVRWGMSTDDLLELAVAHELTHVLCKEPGEAKANLAARTLLNGKPLSCEVRLAAKTRTEEMNSSQQGDSLVFNPAAHAPSPPSDLMEGHIGTNGSAVSVHELGIPDKAREPYNKGVRQLDAADWLGSIPNFQRAIKSFPTFYEAYSGLGGAELSMQSWDSAEAAFRKSIELSRGTFAPAHFGLGVIFCHRNQFADAEATIRDGIELDPADAHGHFSLAWVLYAMGRLPEAERSAHEAILYKPTFPDPYFLLAQIHLLQRNPSAEIEDLNGCLKVDPNGPLSARARAERSEAQRSLANGNTSAPTKP